MTASAKFPLSKNSDGSAAVEFVLILGPLLVAFNLCVFLVLTSFVKIQSVQLAERAVEYCSLVDVSESDLSIEVAKIAPTWLRVSNMICTRDQGVVELTFDSALAAAPVISESTTWHGIDER